MLPQRYYIHVDSRDDCDFAIALGREPEPVPLSEVGQYISMWLNRFVYQGYFSNCNREQIPLEELEFRLVPEALRFDVLYVISD